MTTIRDMILRDLCAIGAAGVGSGKETVALEVIERGHYWPLPSDRPAFLDADGRLVPLPGGWKLAYSTGSSATYESADGAIVKFFSRGLWTASPSVGIVKRCATAPEAWAAAEAWLKEQGR